MTQKDSEADDSVLVRRYRGWCSFCRKHYHDVGPLAEGPDQVYICYRCVQACAALIEAECQRRGTDLPRALASGFEVPELEETKKQIRSIVAEISELSKTEVAPEKFYAEFLPRVVAALAAVGAAVWVLNRDGQLVLKYHVNIQQAGLDDSEQHRAQHNQLLHAVLSERGETLVRPHSTPDGWLSTDPQVPPVNPTNHLLLFGFLKTEQEMVGLVEVFQRFQVARDTPPNAVRAHVRFLAHVCEFASSFERRMCTRRTNE